MKFITTSITLETVNEGIMCFSDNKYELFDPFNVGCCLHARDVALSAPGKKLTTMETNKQKKTVPITTGDDLLLALMRVGSKELIDRAMAEAVMDEDESSDDGITVISANQLHNRVSNRYRHYMQEEQLGKEETHNRGSCRLARRGGSRGDPQKTQGFGICTPRGDSFDCEYAQTC
jgi:hypothetical protein